MVKLIWRARHKIFGDRIPQSHAEIEESINSFIQMREFEILISCDWNLDKTCGYDILRSMLMLANPQYEFSDLLDIVINKAIKDIFINFNISKKQSLIFLH